MREQTKRRTLIIGVGNADRGDDSIGLEVLRKLRALNPESCDFAESGGDPTQLMDLWQGRDRVEIVDACMTPDRSPGEWLVIDATAGEIAGVSFPSSTHALGLREALELGRILGNIPASVRLWLICAGDFTPLQPAQPAVWTAGDQVLAAMQKTINDSR